MSIDRTIRPGEPVDSGPKGARLAMVATAGVGLLVVLLVLLVAGPFAGWSALLGALLGVGNLFVLARLGKAMTGAAAGSRAMWGLLAAFKFVLLLLVVALLLRYKAVDAWPLMVGYGALPVGITLSSWLSRFMARQREPSQET